jgi:hypothetical protein
MWGRMNLMSFWACLFILQKVYLCLCVLCLLSQGLIFFRTMRQFCWSQWPLTCWDCGFESHRGHGYLLWVLCTVR